MITDLQNTLTVGTSTTAPTASVDIIDLGSQRQDIGEGRPLYTVWTVTDNFTGGNGAYFQIYTCDNNDKTGNVTQLAQLQIATASLTLGAQFVIQLPHLIGNTYRRYLYVQVANDGTLTNTNGVTVNIVLDVQDGKTFYASGIKFS